MRAQVNDFFQRADKGGFSFGGGGSGQGLWLDAFMQRGTSAACETYANPHALGGPRNDTFEVAAVELWGFECGAQLEGNCAGKCWTTDV